MQPSGRIKRYLALAAKEAHSSTMKYRHGAVLVKGGRIISKGYNHIRKTIGGSRTCNSTHAEMDTLLQLGRMAPHARKNLAKGSDLFVVRLGGRAQEEDSFWQRNSRPCPNCVEWMYQHGVRRVYYTVGQDNLDRYFNNNEEKQEGSREEDEEERNQGDDLGEALGRKEMTQSKQEGWSVEKVEDLKRKMETILKYDLSRYRQKRFTEYDSKPFLKEDKEMECID